MHRKQKNRLALIILDTLVLVFKVGEKENLYILHYSVVLHDTFPSHVITIMNKYVTWTAYSVRRFLIKCNLFHPFSHNVSTWIYDDTFDFFHCH